MQKKEPETYNEAINALAAALFVQAREDDLQCEQCDYNRTFTDREPYGETTAERTTEYCNCPAPADCPGVIQLINMAVEAIGVAGYRI